LIIFCTILFICTSKCIR